MPKWIYHIMDLITVPQLSALIHKAESSIYSDLLRNPQSLPPVLRIKGSRRVLFCDVVQWLNNQTKTSLEALTVESIEPVPRKIGRPTKSEQLTRARRAADARLTRRSRVG